MRPPSRLPTQILGLLDKCSEPEILSLLKHLCRRFPDPWARATERVPHPLEVKWNVPARVILDAIARSSDLTLRGIRGIIAEAAFEQWAIPSLSSWTPVGNISGDSFDFLLRPLSGHSTEARVQVKLQRLEKQLPKIASSSLRRRLNAPPETLFVVEVQRTRTGKSKGSGENTRPYKFGEFDLLAVNMHPSTGDWKQFRYTVAAWLLPRLENPGLIQIMQPVAAVRDACWTDSLSECLDWYASGTMRRLYQ